jgi:hypothetical protein
MRFWMSIEFIEHCVPIWMAFGSVFPPRMTLAESGEVGELWLGGANGYLGYAEWEVHGSVPGKKLAVFKSEGCIRDTLIDTNGLEHS